MASERVFNFFLYFDKGIAKEYGVRHHRGAGSDQEKTAFLVSRVKQDCLIARRFLLSRSFTPEEWLAAMRAGEQLGYFEGAFQLFKAPAAPVFCITAIVDGAPVVERQIGPGPYQGNVATAQEGYGAVPDYLVHYTKENTFRFAELIRDDYFKAIRTLFNEKLYVSCAKLLMSCVDTLAYVEYGDVQGNFLKWLDTYVDLKPYGISSGELWEFRNSVLHMTNLASRKVIAGDISPIIFYVGGPEAMPPVTPDLPKLFNLHELIRAISKGIGKWGETYNADPDKMLKFIERYDTTISDVRVAYTPYLGKADSRLAE